MSIAKCLDDKVAEGKLTRDQAEEALKIVKRLEAEFAERMSPEMAESVASAEAARRMAESAALNKRQTALQILRTARNVQDVTQHPKGIANGVLALLARDRHDVAKYSNVDKRINAVLGVLHSKWADGMNRFRSKKAGLTQDKLGIRTMVRELYGTDTGDAAAKAAARSWTETIEYAKARFRLAGGRVSDLEDWRLPQTHDARRLKKVGYQEWRDFIGPLIDRERMIDFQTRERVNDLRFEEILSQAYLSITTRGMNDLIPGRGVHGGKGPVKLADRHNLYRVFHFKSPDAWLDYNGRFGSGDGGIFQLLTGHLRKMSRDIGLVEILGPDPDSMFRHLQGLARKEGASGELIGAVYKWLTGRANIDANPIAAQIGRNTRNFLVSAQLGRAFITAFFSDPKFLTRTATWNGIPASRVLARTIKLLNPANEADRLAAVRLNLVAEGWTTRALAAQRFQDEVIGNDVMARFADFTMRATGLSPWTAAGRAAFGEELLAFMAEQAVRRFDALDPALSRSLTRYGLSAADWEIIRRAPFFDIEGVKFVRAENILDMDDISETTRIRVASKLLELVESEKDFAIPSPDALVRGITTLGRPPGSFLGEVMRSGAMYKSFPISITTTHLMRGASRNGAFEKTKYLADLIIGTTVLAAFGLQARQILAGKDPLPVNDWRFWGDAFFRGGGGGLYGDLLTYGAARSDRSLVAEIAGPVGGLIDDTGRLVGGNIKQLAQGKDTNFGREVARFVRRYTPGNTFWYSSLATNRFIFDRLQEMVDPDYSRSFLRAERRAMREFDQGYFFAPGETLPRRAPNLETVIRQ